MNTRNKRRQFRKQKNSMYRQPYSNKYKLIPVWADGKPDVFDLYKKQVRDSHREYRAELIIERGSKCAMCSDESFLTLHHTEYVVGEAGLRWIVVLCENCHKTLHQKVFKDLSYGVY